MKKKTNKEKTQYQKDYMAKKLERRKIHERLKGSKENQEIYYKFMGYNEQSVIDNEYGLED